MKNKKYYIWGTGHIAEEINSQHKEQIEELDIVGYIDNDSQKVGQLYKGKRVYGPDILLEDKDCYIIIANAFREDIISQIKDKYPKTTSKIMESLFFQRMDLLSRYEDNREKEIKNIVDYLKENPLDIFNYPFVKKYDEIEFDVEFDVNKGLYYTFYYGKKMFFSRKFKSEKEVKSYYKSVCVEQDFKSPHRYLTDIFTVPKDAVVIDAGVAEGNFALSVIEYVKRIYLFEPDEEWAEALRYTFEPYENKVVLINKSISNYINGKTTTIDSEIGEKIDFIKMDIEGEEYYALEGAEKTIEKSPNMQCVICTYHQEFAYEIINKFLLGHGFNTQPSKGYMWYPCETFGERAPILRRGLIRAQK